MTDVRTYRAASMQEALNRVRKEMGAEAVILHTRQIAQRRWLPWNWKKPKNEVEITAGLGVNVRSSGARRSTGEGPSRARPRGSGASTAASASPEPPKTQVSGSRSGPNPETKNVMADLSKTATAILEQQRAEGNATTAELSSKLDSIHKMLENLGREQGTGANGEIPGELFHLYTELIDADVEDQLAHNLVFQLKEKATPDQLSDGGAARNLLTGLVESEVRCSGPIIPTPGRRKVVALVGSTGVGKTTTIAKLAANFRLREKLKMGLVTVDTYRIAAVEQLRTYAEIIDLPMKVVTSPLEMRRALDELVGLDLVLIDTAGRSPRDELQIQELKTLLAEAQVDQVHLVLNMTASLRSLEAAVEKFSAANTTSVVLTKLDEAAGLGTLLSLSRRIDLPISYLTTGQDVPDDIEPAHAQRIARLILGQEKLSA